MNENDKILINVYLDDELSAEEMKSIERLIASDNDANEYANKIKRANLEINSYYETNEFKELHADISTFVEKELEENKSDQINLNFFNRFSSFFSNISITNYALTATLFFAVGLSFNQIIGFNNQMNFTDSIVKLDIKKTRSSDSKDIQIKTLLERMIKEKKLNGELVFNNEISYLQISKKTLSNNNYECFEGSLVSDKTNKNFLFCISISSTSLLYDDL